LEKIKNIKLWKNSNFGEKIGSSILETNHILEKNVIFKTLRKLNTGIKSFNLEIIKNKILGKN